MKLKNKILIITLIFVAIILFGNKTFATDQKMELPTLPESVQEFIKDKYYFACSVYGDNNTIEYYICEKPLLFVSYDEGSSSVKNNYYDYVYIPNTDYCKTYYLRYQTKDSTFYNYDGIVYNDNIRYISYSGNQNINGVKYFGQSRSKLSILKSNFDVYGYVTKRDSSYNIFIDTDSKNLVFQVPPQGLTQVLEEGYQTAQKITTQSITQQLGVLVPVGVVIMATLILVSLIAYFRFWRQ